MKTRLLLPALLLALLAPVLCAENEIGFAEKFALAADREATLQQLIPGSEEFYFYSALQYQNTRNAPKLKAILDQWAKRFPQSTRRPIIENREALLTYDTKPEATLKFLRDHLHLEFNHEPQARDQKPDLPAALDPKLISRASFLHEALQDSDDLSKFHDAALEALVRDKTPLSDAQRRALLQNLKRPDLPGLVNLVLADLKSQESGGFGEFDLHKALLPEQLDELATRLPDLLDDETFVFTRLKQLAPGADADADADPAVREAWLDRLWAYAKNLGPSFNGLKAQILYQRLLLDRSRGIYDRARFLAYLELPRQADYVRPEYLARRGLADQAFDLNEALSEPLFTDKPIGDDTWLIREYLLEFFKTEETWKPWAAYLRDTFVKPLFAEAKVTNGLGDPEKWAALLSPSAFQELKERVDLEFSPANPQTHAVGEEVSLTLLVKNAPKLIVKIYELNTLSFFLTQQRALNTDLQLDGLVANSEKTYAYNDPPLRRVARKFDFPELKAKRGAWLIEFIGGGKSSRALIRKGQWSLLQNVGPGGDLITVLDEQHAVVPDAVAWLEGRKFTADPKTGRIQIPFRKEAVDSQPIILADAAGDFATLTHFQQHAEDYALSAKFHLDREQLLPRNEATVALRAELRLNDAPMALGLLSEPKLTITSTTLDGIATTREIKDLKLESARELLETFTVPERLATLEITLSAKIDSLTAGGERKELSDSHQWSINGIDQTDATFDGHFSRFGARTIFELLGKNGEPLADRQVVCQFTHRDFTAEIEVPLRTDEHGRIDLGELPGISHVNASLENGRSAWCDLGESAAFPETIHALAGESIEIPWLGPAKLTPADVSLLEVRGEDTCVRDRFDAISAAHGCLTIKGLAPGDYRLLLRGPQDNEVTIRITAGSPVAGWLVGANRRLESPDAPPVAIESISLVPAGAQPPFAAPRKAAEIVIRLHHATAHTRVHITATRFLPEQTLFEQFGDLDLTDPDSDSVERQPDLFAAGRLIGDEYRYILERRYAAKFPGNMLARPGLLLDPWETRTTDVQPQAMSAAEPQTAAESAPERDAAEKLEKESAGADKSVAPAGAEGSNLDFLATPSRVFYNLLPDAQAVVHLDPALLGDRQHLQVYVTDLSSAELREFALPEQPVKFRDLRLAHNLDPQKHFAGKKEISVLAAGQTLTLGDILTSDLETYDSLASVHALYTTLSNDATLAKFAWVLQWPTFKEEEKRAKYSEFACHELDFFLSRKDPDFFQKVIIPFLRNKKEKTFLDDWLIGADLQKYLEPWAYARLNAVECALLAQRIPGEAAATARHQRDLWELLPPQPDLADRLFDTALHGQAMNGAGALEKGKEAAETVVTPLDAEGFNPLDRPAASAATSATGGAAPRDQYVTRGLILENQGGVSAPSRGGVEQVKQWFTDAHGYYDTARWDLAYKRCEQILGLDPYDIAARKLEEEINHKKDDYALAGNNSTRAQTQYPFSIGTGTTQTFPVTGALRTGRQAISQNAIDALVADTSGVSAPDPAVTAIAGIVTNPNFKVTIHALDQKKPGFRDGSQLGEKLSASESEEVKLHVAPDVAFLEDAGVASEMRRNVRQFYRSLGPAKEWAETNYYALPLDQPNAGLITVNAFWRDYAAWDGKSPFVSPHLAEASRNFAEMMLALAVLDLPFDAPKAVTKSENGQFTLTAAGPLIAYHQEIQPAELAAPGAPAQAGGELLVSENFFRKDDPDRMEGNEKFDKFVTGEFLAGVVYGANVVVTNPTSTPQKLEVLLQIPKGALPIAGAKPTDTKRVRIEPYNTQTFSYFFYFPAAATQPLPHAPAQVSRDEHFAGSAKPTTFTVVRQLSEIDKTSWDYLSQYGAPGDVFAFLEKNNLDRLDLARIAWRARKSADFFHQLLAVLAARHTYSDVIYSYAIVHNDPAALREWLRHHDDFVDECGPYLASKLLTIDPIERRAYEHLEYAPLINQRMHRLGAEPTIANPVLREHYQSLLAILAHKPRLDAMDELSVVYYLFLQDRVEEALARLASIKPELLPTRLQYDYLRCYAAFYEEKLADARGIAAQYANYPVDRWRKLFADVTAQLDEIAGQPPAAAANAAKPAADPAAKPDREAQQGALAETEPSFDFKVENRTIALTWKNLTEVTVNYYLMDPEFLFSSSPFVSQDPGRFSIIKPAKTVVQKLAAGQDTLSLPLPEEYAKANVLIEILGAGRRKAEAYHANTLKLAVAENYGSLELRDQAAGKPIAKAYVKVYARLRGGAVRFYKDGYTDLRGKFDYASLNAPENSGSDTSQTTVSRSSDAAASENPTLDNQMLRPDELGAVEKLSILVLSEVNGAIVKEVKPPAQ